MNDKEKLEYILAEIKEILEEDPLFNDLGLLKERLEDMQWVIEEVKGSDDYSRQIAETIAKEAV